MRFAGLLFLVLASAPLRAQWTLQDSHTTADLRGIHALSKEVAWASGSSGTVMRTLNAGATWLPCTAPPGGAKLDFRGVQAFDAQTALVMSSGKGELSRLYRTTDGCKSWTEVFRNPDAKGFFDCMRRVTESQVFVLGDPVDGKFAMFTSRDKGVTWFIADDPGLDAPKDAGAFAASNSSLNQIGSTLLFGSGGPTASLYKAGSRCDAKTGVCTMAWRATETPMAHGQAASGIFSVGGRQAADQSGRAHELLVAVGGTYDKPADGSGAAAYSSDGGAHWTLAQTMPGGYRSTLAYDSKGVRWLAAGPNGTDLSTDDGHTWTPLKPSASDVPDADQHWNALSLPFAVGPKGRIGVLRDGALAGAK